MHDGAKDESARLTEKAVLLGREVGEVRKAGRGLEVGKGLAVLRVNTRILELEPENAAALTRRGLCSLAMDDLDAAKRDLSRALELRHSGLVEDALGDVERGWDGRQERMLARVEAARSEAEKERAEAARLAEEERMKAEKERTETARRAEDLRTVEATTSFEVAYAIGVARSKGDPPDYDLAIAALKKAYRVDPRRKVGPGEAPDPRLFEAPTRLARVLRDARQLDEAERMYLWVLERHDSRYAMTGLAAVYEDKGEHQKALETYEGVLERYPRDPYALRGIARTFSSLGRVDEAIRAYYEAAQTASDREDRSRAVAGLRRMRNDLLRKGDEVAARQVDDALGGLGDADRRASWVAGP